LASQEEPQHKISVLIADDHAAFREGLISLLHEEPDFDIVGEAGNGLEATELAAQLSPDVAIIDVAMPGVNGIEAMRRIRVESPNTRFVVLSAFSYDSYVLAAMRAGASAYVLKTECVRVIAEALRSVHSGRMVFSSEVNTAVRRRFDSTGVAPSQLEIHFSDRERELLVLAARGLSIKEIAAAINIGERTVQTHFHNILTRLGTTSRTETVVLALAEGWISFDDVRSEGQLR
jgi:DNA-binding NarL/FixJ family response regulator